MSPKKNRLCSHFHGSAKSTLMALNLFFENLLNFPFLTQIPHVPWAGFEPICLWHTHMPNSTGINVKMYLLQQIRYQDIDWVFSQRPC